VSNHTLPPIRARVAAGAALLDRNRPGWHVQVDPARLDMAAEYDDLLGQLLGHFQVGLDTLTPAGVKPWSFAVAHGFDLPPVEAGWGAYAQLTACWRSELLRRRGGEGR
jgi:hypothetical protein